MGSKRAGRKFDVGEVGHHYGKADLDRVGNRNLRIFLNGKFFPRIHGVKYFSEFS